MQEAARSGGEELLDETGGAQGGSRAVGIWEGAAMQVADHSKRVVSGGGWWDVLCCGGWQEEVCGWIRTFQTLKQATSLAPSRLVRLERAACQRRRVGVQGGRVRAAAREQLRISLSHTCTLYGTWERVGAYARRRCGSNGLGTAHAWQGGANSARGSCGAVAGLAHSLEQPLTPFLDVGLAPAVNSVSVNSVFGCWPPPKQRLGG